MKVEILDTNDMVVGDRLERWAYGYLTDKGTVTSIIPHGTSFIFKNDTGKIFPASLGGTGIYYKVISELEGAEDL